MIGLNVLKTELQCYMLNNYSEAVIGYDSFRIQNSAGCHRRILSHMQSATSPLDATKSYILNP